MLTYVLATQSVAFGFLQLLDGEKKIDPNQRSGKYSEGEKAQFHSLILKYNDMSHFGT